MGPLMYLRDNLRCFFAFVAFARATISVGLTLVKRIDFI
jgi:hypothetical protein